MKLLRHAINGKIHEKLGEIAVRKSHV